MAAEGAEQLLQACENIVKGQGEQLKKNNYLNPFNQINSFS